MKEMTFNDILSECMHVTIDKLKQQGHGEIFDGPFSAEQGKLAYPQFDFDLKGRRGFVFVYPCLEEVTECIDYVDQDQLTSHIEWAHQNSADFYASFIYAKSEEANGKFYFGEPISYKIHFDMIPCVGLD